MYFDIFCITLVYFILCCENGSAIGISPRDEFSSSHSQKSSLKIANDAEEVFAQIKKETWRPEDEHTSHNNFVKKNAEITEDDTSIVCKNKVCVYTNDEIKDENSKSKSVAADVHVIVSTNIKSDGAQEKDKPKIDNSEDVPILKGFTGVKADDINWSQEEKVKKTRNHNEQPSSLVTNPYSGRPTIVNINDKPQKPLNHFVPPSRPAPPWSREVQRKSFQASPPVYIDNYPRHEHDHRNVHYDPDTRDVRVPSGWSSNWKPIVPAPSPGDYYHYNVNGNGNGFAGTGPRYETVCKCTRELVHGSLRTNVRQSGYYLNHPTTTKASIDDKLDKPFEPNKNEE